MPYFRHRSFVFAPASASLSTPMICSSVNRRLFIRLLPDEQTLLHSGTNLGEQTTLAIARMLIPRRDKILISTTASFVSIQGPPLLNPDGPDFQQRRVSSFVRKGSV